MRSLFGSNREALLALPYSVKESRFPSGVRLMRIKHYWLAMLVITLTGVSRTRADDQGTIRGVVKWAGEEVPPRRTVSTASDPNCVDARKGKPLLSEDLIVNANGTVKNVFVYVKSGLPKGRRWSVPAEPKVLDQKGCRYEPHVLGIMAGQKLVLRNSDGTVHNINCKTKNNPPFNVMQPFPNMKTEKTFDRAEMMMHLVCNVHPWMSAYCAVMDHPFFAVTDAEGRFEIKGLPAGEYTVATWHENEKLKPLETKVSLAAGEVRDHVEFELSP